MQTVELQYAKRGPVPCAAGGLGLQEDNWQVWCHQVTHGLQRPAILGLARNYNGDTANETVIVLSTLKHVLCVEQQAVTEQAFDKAYKLSAQAGVWVANSPQLLARAKACKLVVDHATSITLANVKGVRAGIRSMMAPSASEPVAKAFTHLGRCRMPGQLYVHSIAQAGSAAEVAAAPAASTEAVSYYEDTLTWPINSSFPQTLPPRTFTPAEMATA